MVKKILFFLIFCLGIKLIAVEIHEYNFTLLKSIPFGNEKGAIGYWKLALKTGSAPGPTTFSFNNENKVFVPDYVNNRINVYDENFIFLHEIDTKKSKAHFAKTIRFDKDNNIICFSYFGMEKVNSQGDQIFFIDIKELSLKMKDYYSYFPIEDHIYYYDNDFYVHSITPNGKFESNAQALVRLEKINEKISGKKDNNKMNKLLEDRKNIVIGDKFITGNKYHFKNYFKILNEKNKSEAIEEMLEFGFGGFIGYDDKHNSYWTITRKTETGTNMGVVVISKSGKILDALFGNCGEFKNGSLFMNFWCAISPDGDIYVMRYDDDSYNFYRLEKRW